MLLFISPVYPLPLSLPNSCGLFNYCYLTYKWVNDYKPSETLQCCIHVYNYVADHLMCICNSMADLPGLDNQALAHFSRRLILPLSSFSCLSPSFWDGGLVRVPPLMLSQLWLELFRLESHIIEISLMYLPYHT